MFLSLETVFLCAWFDETPQIYTRSGYKLRGVISNTLTLEISQVSQSHAGQYVCHFIPSNTKPEKPCALNVTGNECFTTKSQFRGNAIKFYFFRV